MPEPKDYDIILESIQLGRSCITASLNGDAELAHSLADEYRENPKVLLNVIAYLLSQVTDLLQLGLSNPSLAWAELMREKSAEDLTRDILRRIRVDTIVKDTSEDL